jgi:threonine dehydratase
VGGGGLIAGIATVVKARQPDVRIVAVQPAASPALAESLRLGRPLLEYDAGPTLADGLAGGIGLMAWEHRGLIDAVVNVPEAETERAMVMLLAEEQVLAEASGAVGVAALRAGLVGREGTPVEDDGRPVAVVVTGANVDTRVLSRLLSAES